MWATGCVVAELLQGFPLLDGTTEVEQMQKMVSCLGRPSYGTERVDVVGTKEKVGLDLWDRFDTVSKEGLGLLTMLLEYNADERWTAQQALQSDYFTVEPLPASDDSMPFFDKIHQTL
jgi:serine/threonine protein kinase